MLARLSSLFALSPSSAVGGFIVAIVVGVALPTDLSLHGACSSS